MKRATPLFVVALVGGGIIIGTLVRPVAGRMDMTPPQIGWSPAIMLFTIAVLIGGLAWSTWQSLHRKHERMTSDHGVKLLALSRSCLIVAGLFAGGYGGYALSFVPDLDTPLGSARVWHAASAAVAGVLLGVAALLLERACHIPGGDDEDPEPDADVAPSAA